MEVGDIILKYNGYSTTIEENTLQTIAELTRAYSPDENGIIIEVTREGDVIRTVMIPEFVDGKPYCGFFIIPY